MDWASVWCKSQDRSLAPPRIVSLIDSFLRNSTRRIPTGAPQPEPHPTPAHSLRLSGGLIPAAGASQIAASQPSPILRCTLLRNPTGPPAHPHHPLQAHEPSGCQTPALCRATRFVSTRRIAKPRNPTGEGNFPTPHLSARGCQVG